MIRTIIFAISLLLLTVTNAHAGLIKVDYNGSFNEDTVLSEDGLDAGDYDTIGGLEDVAVFELVAGSNDFFGSIFSPSDSSDVFTIEIAEGMRLVGATIDWALNLPSIALDFNNPDNGYLGQNTWGNNAPDWYVEESSIEPEVFTIENLEASAVGFAFDIAPSSYTADSFSREQGIYSSLLSGSGTCAQTYSQAQGGIGLVASCQEAIDYKMSFIVELIQPPVSDVPEPSSMIIFAFAMLGFISHRLIK